MVKIEIELTESMNKMLDALKQKYGEEVVDADLTNAVYQSIKVGYMQLSKEITKK